MTTYKRIETLAIAALSAGVGATLTAGCYWQAGLLAICAATLLFAAFTEPDFTAEEYYR